MAPTGSKESRWIFKDNIMVLKNPESSRQIFKDNTIAPTNLETGDTILKRNILHIFECMDIAASTTHIGHVDPGLIENILRFAADILRENGAEQEAHWMETASFLDLNNESVRLAVAEFRHLVDGKKNVVTTLSQYRKSSKERFPPGWPGCDLAVREEAIQYCAAALGTSPNEMIMDQHLDIMELETKILRARQETSEINNSKALKTPEEERIAYYAWRATSKVCQQKLQAKNFKPMEMPQEHRQADAAFPSFVHSLAVLKSRPLKSPQQITLCEISREMKNPRRDHKKAYKTWRA